MRWLLLALTACGRIGFDASGANAPNDSIAGHADGDPAARANRVFVTSGTTADGSFGGVAAADAMCAAAAIDGGWPGTFLALLSTSTVDARDRFGASRGWMRVDGVPVADTMAKLFSAEVYNPITLDEHGGAQLMKNVWTGTRIDGRYDSALSCLDWTSASGVDNVQIARTGATPGLFNLNPAHCNDPTFGFYCFEVGHTATFSHDRPANARLVFISTALSMATLGAIDTKCATDATAAGLPGTYKALIAPTGATIASRFVSDSRVVVRVDSTVVADSAASFLAGNAPRSWVNQRAAGTYILATSGVDGAWTGAATPTSVAVVNCNNWNDLSAGAMGAAGTPYMIDPAFFWGNASATCGSAFPVMCLQE